MAAGYRDAILSMGPKAFYTFDNDTAYDPVSRMLLAPYINDDTSNGNTGTINVVDDQGGGQSFGYCAGMNSLVYREQYPQLSFVFGWKGFNTWGNLDQVHYPYVSYPKAYVTLPSTLGSFDSSGGSPQPGSFSIVMHVMKDQRESDPGGLKTNVSGVSDSVYRPIFAWDGILYVYFLEAEFNNFYQNLCVTFSPGTGLFDKYISAYGTQKNPVGDGAQITINMPAIQGDGYNGGATNYTKDSKHVVITWKADTSGGKGLFSVYVDGECMFSNKMENFLTSQIVHNWKNSPFYIGGLPYTWTNNDIPYVANIETPTTRAGNYGTYNIPQDFPDRATTGIHVDQLAIFDYALSRPQVGYLWMKTRNYSDSVRRLQPLVYLPLNEPNVAGVTLANRYTDPNTTAPDYSGSGWNITGSGQAGYPGPPNIQNSGSYRFTGGALAGSSTLSAKDFTIEMWVNIDSTFSDRGVLFSYTGVDYPYWGGATLQVNWREDIPSVGSLQFNIDASNRISSRLGVSVTDGQWHHIVCMRKKNSISLWVDGQKQGATNNITWNSSISKIYSQMHMMNHQDGMLPVIGYLSNVSIYAYAVPSWAIKYHYRYNVLYRIRGTTVELGSAEQTDVRLINHGDGSLSQRIVTDPTLGTFEFNPNVSTYYDIFAIDSWFDPPSARAFGPMVPTTYPDTNPYRRFNDSDYFNPGP